MTAERANDIAALLSRLAADPLRPALTFYRGKVLAGRLSYGELAAKVDVVAAGLCAKLGVRAGDRVAILSPNRLEVPVVVMALLRLGAVVVPLNPTSAPEDLSYILSHSKARGLFTTRELAGVVPQASRPEFVLSLEDAFALDGPAPAPVSGLDERMAVILYTSGTTGSPKGVALRQRNLLSNARSMAANFGLAGTTQLAVLPLHHAHAFGFGLMSALSTGGHLVFTDGLEPFTWAQVIRNESVTVASVVPPLLPMLLAANVTHDKVPSLRHLMVSSAPLARDLASTFETKTRIRLTQGWGLSEYTNFACCMPPAAPSDAHHQLMYGWDVPSVGPALEGTEVRIVDASGALATEGAAGELQVRGHSTMMGYYEDAANTARALDADGWLHTGDQGVFRMHGAQRVFFVTGRIKEIIIRDAEKYSPLRLEQRLVEALPELSGRLVVLGFPHQAHGEEVGAYVELATLDDPLRARLSAAIQGLTLAERPKVVLYGMRAVPRTHTGKIQRRKMHGWFEKWAAHRGAIVMEPLGDSTD
jgi:long-chain acyl-CoA synthetase